MTRPAALLVALWAVCAGAADAQGPVPGRAAGAPEKDLATVYVYRHDEGSMALWFLVRTLPVYVSEQATGGPRRPRVKVAGLKNKRYFMLRLPPGKYVFDSRLLWGHFDFEAAAGGVYYLRLDKGNTCPNEDPDYWFISSNCQSSSTSFESVTPERWLEDMPKLKPIKPKDVKDRKLVIIPPDGK